MIVVCHCLERGPQGCLRRSVRAVDQLADERLQTGIEGFELGHRDVLARGDPRLEEAGDRARERAPAPVLLGSREHGRDDLPVALGERAEEQLAFAPFPPVETLLSSLRPFRRRRPTGGDRGHCPGAEKFGPRSATSANVSSSMLSRIGKQLDEPRELLVVVELIDVDPGVGLGEHLARARSPPPMGVCFCSRLRTLR